MLKKAFQPDLPSFVESSYFRQKKGFISTFNMEIDWWMFKNNIQMARVHERAGDVKRAIEGYCRAIDLYNGDFLPQVENPLVVKRTRWEAQRLFLSAVKNLATLRKEQNEYETVVDVCEKGYLVDPCDEDILELMIEACLKTGKYFRALKVYKEYEKRLRSELGILPSARIKKLIPSQWYEE